MNTEALVGRGDGLRAVASLRAEYRARGETQLGVIVGAPGIGKTAFLEAILTSAANDTIRVRAERTDERQPYATLARLLRAADGKADRTSVVDRLHETSMVRRLSKILRSRKDVVVAVDDAQWLDDESRHVLAKNAINGAFGTLLLAERERGALAAPWSEAVVRLGPLPPSSAAQLARRVAPHASAGLVEEILHAAGGVPFGIVLLARALRSRTASQAPDIVELIGRRLARESALAEMIARVIAAYECDPAPIPALALACGVEPYAIAAALAGLTDVIATDGETAVFRHRILVDVVRAYDPAAAMTSRMAFEGERRSEDDSLPGLRRLREAARRCGEQRTFLVVSISLGTRLAQANAHDEAALVLGEVWDTHREVDGQVVRDYLDVLRVLGRDEEAVRIGRIAFHEALARNDGVAAARIAGAVVHGLATLDLDDEITAFLADAASRPPIALNTEATSYLHGIALSDAAFDGDLAKYDALAALAPLQPRELRADAYARALRGDSGGSDAAIAQWRASYGNWPVWDDSLEVHRRLFLRGPAACETWFAMIGHARIDHHLNAAAAARTWGLYLLATGRWQEADDLFVAIDPFKEPAEYRFLLLEVRLMLDALRAEPPREGLRILDELQRARNTGRERSVWATAAWWVAANARCRHRVPPDITSFVADLAHGWPRPSHLAAIPLAAVLGRPRLTDEQARKICAAAPVPGSEWLAAHRALADVLLNGDTVQLRAVRDSFDELAAPGFAMIAGLELPEPRERDVTLAQSCRYVGISRRHDYRPLSSRERDVAELVAGGKSNLEVSRTLNIALRTVETHLTHIYDKLQVSTRAELVVLFQRE
ncbi:MAG: LuxR family transcriptional regulator [Candidatus Eremiobacteraeota bacterium]|nr:LuxR family transcriptional regulator [Candidatus Eremiobacteraeota bacterium]